MEKPLWTASLSPKAEMRDSRSLARQVLGEDADVFWQSFRHRLLPVGILGLNAPLS